MAGPIRHGQAVGQVLSRAPHLHDVEADVFVEGVQDDLGETVVAPDAVRQHELVEEAELGNGVVRAVGGLQALSAADAYAYICCLREGGERGRHW